MPDPVFTFDGVPLRARPGDTIAAALADHGIATLGRRTSGRPRGFYCGMGACRDCLVIVDGRRSVRACMEEAAEGMEVRPQDDLAGEVAPLAEDAPRPRHLSVDLCVVGAGPAGLEAAIAAAQAGLSVCVLDERSDAGGQYYKPPSTGARRRADDRQRDGQHRAGDALRARFAASGAVLETGAQVWFARAEGGGTVLRTLRAGRETVLRARAVVLATGAVERPAPVPGWAEPGVMTIGAAQTLVRRYGVAPGDRVLVAGHGPLGLQLGAELVALGARVVAVAERSAMTPLALARAALADPGLGLAGARHLATLARAGVPVLRDTEVREIGPAGAEGAREVRLSRLRGHGERVLLADTVCMSDGFLPQMELARLLGCTMGRDAHGHIAPDRADDGETDVPGVWIAGDAGGLAGAPSAQAQGRLAGLAAARFLGREAPPDAAAEARLARAGRFQKALWRAFAAPERAPPTGGTLVCRCESVTAAQVDAAIAGGATDPGAVKRVTRCGMGRCQGRVCMTTLAAMLEARGHAVPPAALMAPQIPARPVPVAALCREKPEWGGHRPDHPAARPRPPETAPLPVTRADLVVIGAGVTGLAAALEAAEQGASVLVLDRGQASAEASGGNAGSLHLQLLSWDFGAKAVAGGSPQLRTLRLQAESIGLWQALERELGADFEMATTGGLMLAETRDQIGFLEAKARAEAGMGVETHVVGRDEIARIAPALSERFVAAAWCPGEGKINPLAANRALLEAVRVAGVQVAERAPVTGLTRDGTGYCVATPRGEVRAGRLVIAAGGWSSALTEMLGVPVPVRGAPLQMVVTEPAPPLVGCLVAHADRHLTLKQSATGQILIGGAWPARVAETGQPVVLPESLEGNLWVAARTLPAVSGLHVLRSWAAMNIDIDGAPLLSHLPGHPNAVVAATANGYTLGPLVGREAARGALRGAMRDDLAEFDLSRFQLSPRKEHA